MRPKFVFGAIAAAALLLGLVYFTSRTTRSSVAEAQSTSVTDKRPPVTATHHTPRAHSAKVLVDSSAIKEPQDEIAEMDNAMLQVDERTLPLLCAKLSATDRQVRQAAVSNLVTLADRDGIPALSEAADRTADSEEKGTILKAIEFLQLPTYDELIANGTMQSAGKIPSNSNRAQLERFSPATNLKPQPADSSN